MWRLDKGLAHSRCLVDAAAFTPTTCQGTKGDTGWTRLVRMPAGSPRCPVLGHGDRDVRFRQGPGKIFVN